MYQVRGDKVEILKVKALRKYFSINKGFMAKPLLVKALDGVNFSVEEDKIFALVGESGCGKSTVARLVLGLIPPTSGEVLFQGMKIFGLNGDSMKIFRKSVQIIFQDPFASLNPRKRIMDTISEPLRIHNIVKSNALSSKVIELLHKVNLTPDMMYRYPHELSGGQRQRVCIARALAVSPEVIVADEPLSALDVSIQAQILNLLSDLQKKTKMSFLFISHDLRVVHYFSDMVGVMYLGRIVEYSKTKDLFDKSFHPYTVALLDSAPQIKPGERDRVHKAHLKGEVPSLVNIPSGCSFHPRCPDRFEPCDRIAPQLKEYQGRLV